MAEIEARSRAGSYKGLFERCRAKLHSAREELKRVCRTAKDALALAAERDRLARLLDDAGVDTCKRATATSLRIEVARLRGELGGEEPAARGAQSGAGARSPDAAFDPIGAVGGAVRLQEREAEQAEEPSRARPANRQAGHGRTARAALQTKEERHDPPSQTPAGARAAASVCRQWRAGLGAHRNHRQGPCPAHRAQALACGLRVRRLARRGARADAAAAVCRQGVRDQRVGALPP